MRAQLIYRRIPENTHAAIGFMEMKPGSIETELFHGFVQQDGLLTMTGDTLPMEPGYEDADLSSILTAQQFMAPPANPKLAGGMFALRETRVPATDPTLKNYVMVLALRGNIGEMDRKTIYEWHGKGNSFIISPTRTVNFEPNGMTLAQIHKFAIWGWSNEYWAPVSTMRLDALDECDAYEAREDAGKPHPDDMPYWLHQLMAHSYRDKEYREFKKRLKARVHTPKWSGYHTQSSQAAQENQASEIIRDLLAA